MNIMKFLLLKKKNKDNFVDKEHKKYLRIS